MLRNPIVATILSTCYLLVYIYLLDKHWDIAFTMFIFSPIVIIWLVYTILSRGRYTGRQLEVNQEYGYEDRPRLP